MPGINLPTKADDWHQRVEVCKVNGKRVDAAGARERARDRQVFVTLPDPYRAWGATHGFPTRRARTAATSTRANASPPISAPTRHDRLTVGQTLQIVGSAYIDDFASYTLDVGRATIPTTGRPSPTSARRPWTAACSASGRPPACPPVATACACAPSTASATPRNPRR